ncbi:MAG: hypothetical protein HRT88_04165, partial [Lentisphaeraceae bacterium]|nr:hypothetical protein [Lentisphaeraceae bacterium]
VQSTEFLAGVITDLEGNGLAFSLEASRRIGDSFKISVELRSFHGINDDDSLAAFKKDNFAQLSVIKYF